MGVEVIAKDRQRGKTTELIELAARDWLYIVVPNHALVSYTQDLARKMGLDIPQPITWEEFVRDRYYRHGIKGFVIDNLDLCIQQMTRVPIKAVSLTVPEPVPAR